MPTLGLVHTVHRVIPGLAELTRDLLPDVRQLHYLDESVLQDAIALNGLSADIIRRVRQLAQLAAERCEVVLVTCSSIGPAADIAAESAYVPVLRIDRPMAELAVQTGTRIGVIATLGSTLQPTVELVRQCARRAEREVTVTTRLVERALVATPEGDRPDPLMLAAIQELLSGDEPLNPSPEGAVVSRPRERGRGEDPVDVVILAQASMAPVAAHLPPDLQPRVLSSPRSGLLRAGEILRQVAHP